MKLGETILIATPTQQKSKSFVAVLFAHRLLLAKQHLKYRIRGEINVKNVVAYYLLYLSINAVERFMSGSKLLHASSSALT